MKTKLMGKKRVCVETGKICFESHDRALRRIGAIMLSSDEASKINWSAYKCRHCGRYHISSNRGPKLDESKTIRHRRSLRLKGIIK